MLNSAATIFTVDLYRRHLRPASSERQLIAVGRWSTVAFLLMASAWAPLLLSFERVFSYIQEFWGLITPGVAVVFLGGLFWKRATSGAAAWVMGLTLPVTVVIKLLTPGVAFLDQMWIAGLVLIVALAGISLAGRAPEPGALMRSASQATSASALLDRDWLFDTLCGGVVVLTVALYVIFF